MKTIKNKIKRVGILTGGGDCPGLNAAIRAVARRGEQLGLELVGIKDGWKGLIEADAKVLNEKDVSAIIHLGGTILGTSRTNPLKIDGGVEKIVQNFKKLNLDALVAIGGEDTLGVAYRLSEKGIPVVGIPKTIDNDLPGTDFCIGFYSAVENAMQRIDEIHSTAESHHRIMVIEVMGRHAGWLAALAGMASGADYILVPEETADLKDVIKTILSRYEKGKNYSIIVVSEGATLNIAAGRLAEILSKIVLDKTGLEINPEEIEKKFKTKGKTQYVTQGKTLDVFGHIKLGGIGEILTRFLKEETGLDARCVNLGHILRGGQPTAFDRILATRLGVKAIEMVSKREFGKMLTLRGNKITPVSLKKATATQGVSKDIYEVAKIFFH